MQRSLIAIEINGDKKISLDVSVHPLSILTDSQGKERETALREGIGLPYMGHAFSFGN